MRIVLGNSSRRRYQHEWPTRAAGLFGGGRGRRGSGFAGPDRVPLCEEAHRDAAADATDSPLRRAAHRPLPLRKLLEQERPGRRHVRLRQQGRDRRSGAPLYRRGSGGRGDVHGAGARRLRDQHPSRTRPRHCQGGRLGADDGRAHGTQDRLQPGLRRVDAHLLQGAGVAGGQRDRRRRFPWRPARPSPRSSAAAGRWPWLFSAREPAIRAPSTRP